MRERSVNMLLRWALLLLIWHMLLLGIVSFLAIFVIVIAKSFNLSVDYYVPAKEVAEVEAASRKGVTA